jgi:MFS family permease
VDIAKRNSKIYQITQLLHSLIFTIPIWVVFYQARISVGQISFLITFQYIVQMILELPSGALADLIGRRNTTLVGFLVGALAYLFFPLAQGFSHFVVLAFMMGLSDSFRSGAEEALLYDSYKEAEDEAGFTKAYAKGNIIYQVGLITSTALGGFLFSINNSLPYLLYGTSLLLGTVVIAFYIEPTLDSEKFTLQNYIKQMVDGGKEAFKTSYSKYLSLFYIFVGGIAWSSTLYFNAYMMVDLGFSDSMRGYLTAAMRLVNVVVIAKILQNSKLFNKTRTFLFFPILMLMGYLPGVFLQGYWGLPFVQMAMVVTTARWIVLSPLTNAIFSSKYRATAISFLSLLIGFVYIGMTSISGFVIANFGVKTMYTVLGLVSLVTVVPLTYKLLQVSVETDI